MEDVIKKIHEYSLEEIMEERFARYSKYIIQDRAIPDVRDGLKPVQRRIIYAMYKDHNTHDKQFKKCANAVGIVLGKYHPHGDSSVYEAMVRMSQDWKQNHILVEIDGNNGSIDGDGPAAYRYTETRLAKITEELLRDIDKNTVMMAPNYSDTLMEPTVLPAKFPNLLVNGTTGISAGYATNIPPHNLGEIIDATILRIEKPNSTLDEVMELVKGPDFPTGGIVEGIDGIKDAFSKGRGKVVVSSRCEFERVKGKDQIVISEIPFEVNKQLLVKKIDDIRIDKKIDGIAEVRDESDKDSNIRIVIDLKSGADKNLVLNYLLKNTDLQANYNYNMVTIVNRRPRLLGIIPILDAYIEHQREVIRNRSEFDLATAKKEIHTLEGLVKALSILDEVIACIRKSKNKTDARDNLVSSFSFTVEQATAILDLQLYRLTNFDVTVLEEKLAKLRDAIELLNEILSNPKKLDSVIKKELKDIKKNYATERKTEINSEVKEIRIDANDLIIKENVIVVLTHDGYLKKVSKKSFASSDEDTGLKPGDFVIDMYDTINTNKLVIITSMGNYMFIPIHEIINCKWKELGKHISNYVSIHPDDSVIKSFIVTEDNLEQEIVLYSKMGMVKRTKLNDFVVSRYSKLYTSMKLKDVDRIVSADFSNEKNILITKTGYYLSYNINEIPIAGTKASGVKGINLKDDELVKGLTYCDNDEYLTLFTNRNTAKRIKISELNSLSRAKRGSTLIKKVKSTNYEIKNAFITNKNDILGLVTEEINVIKNTDIPIMDEISTGSTISKNDIKYIYLDNGLIDINEVVMDIPKLKENKEEIKEMTIDDFINDFKL